MKFLKVKIPLNSFIWKTIQMIFHKLAFVRNWRYDKTFDEN